jgi:hypothetical protein
LNVYLRRTTSRFVYGVPSVFCVGGDHENVTIESPGNAHDIAIVNDPESGIVMVCVPLPALGPVHVGCPLAVHGVPLVSAGVVDHVSTVTIWPSPLVTEGVSVIVFCAKLGSATASARSIVDKRMSIGSVVGFSESYATRAVAFKRRS